MSRQFPIFLDISNKKIYVYGAGKIASRRVMTLLDFSPCLTVVAPQASPKIMEASEAGMLRWVCEKYEAGTVPEDAFMVLAATDDNAVNEAVWRECKGKRIPVNVCSDRSLCDFQFPGVAIKDDVVIGINAGGADHRLAREWTDRIRKEVEKDGYDDQAEKAQNDSKAQKNGPGDQDG